jgi:sulfotransferase
MTSPLGSIYVALEGALSRRNETAVFIDDAQRRGVLRGVFENYYAPIAADKLVFDTNRIWCAKLPALSQLFPDARMICCVRSISWIMDSFERLVRRNPFELSGIFGFDATTTVYTRINRLAGSDGVVGFALDALREAFFSEHAARLVLIEYGALTRAPEATLRSLYALLGEAYHPHDFANVDYSADEFDQAVGARGLHHVRRKVEWIDRASILPPELFARFENDAFWRHSDAASRGAAIIASPD